MRDNASNKVPTDFATSKITHAKQTDKAPEIAFWNTGQLAEYQRFTYIHINGFYGNAKK
jgi:hypothetical protein